jgi:mediator of RNA polymerase II transcription subunit 5
MANLVQWGLNPGININPANYTHRQILVGMKILGARRLLGAIIEEVKAQSELGNASLVLDVASALVCAPESASWDSGAGLGDIMPLQRRMNLREALKIEVESAPKVQKTDPFHAETLVRLFRKVEGMLLVPHPEQTLALAELHEAIDAGALDGAMSGMEGLAGGSGIDGLAGGSGMVGDLGMGDPTSDLMHGLMSGTGGDVGDLFGGDHSGGLGDGMGF